MAKFNELISLVNDEKLKNDLCCSQKFDLGTADELFDIANLSKLPSINLPFDICLFQISQFDNKCLFMVFAKNHSDGQITYEVFAKSISVNRWTYWDKWLVVDKDANAFCICYMKTGEKISYDDLKNNDGSFSFESTMAAIALFTSLAVEVFSCSNVKTVLNEPSEKLNKKRIKSGKLPFFSYHTLHITGEYKKIESKGGTHSSPRLHLRRGHIRKLSNGIKIWVSQCLVGDKSKGIVGKDYIVSNA